MDLKHCNFVMCYHNHCCVSGLSLYLGKTQVVLHLDSPKIEVVARSHRLVTFFSDCRAVKYRRDCAME